MMDFTLEYKDAICDGGLTSLSRALGSRSAVISTLGVGFRRSARVSRIWRSNETNQAFDSEMLFRVVNMSRPSASFFICLTRLNVVRIAVPRIPHSVPIILM